MDIIKPYEWTCGVIHGYDKNTSKKLWDSVWEFINKIDFPSEFAEFANTHCNYNLDDFIDYVDDKYEYHDEISDSMFNVIGVEEFATYLEKKYSNFNYHVETIEKYRFTF